MQAVIDNGLREDGSAFSPDLAVWTLDNFATLRQHFIDLRRTHSDSTGQRYRRGWSSRPTAGVGAAPSARNRRASEHSRGLPTCPDGVTEQGALGSTTSLLSWPLRLTGD